MSPERYAGAERPLVARRARRRDRRGRSGFVPPPDVLRQELLGLREEMQSVLRLGEAVAFVLVLYVLHLLARLSHRLDHLDRFGSLDPGVVGPLGDEQRP